MSLEQPPIDGTPPGKATLAEILDKLYNQVAGTDGDPDKYLIREVPSTPEQRAHRDLYVRVNQPDTLS